MRIMAAAMLGLAALAGCSAAEEPSAVPSASPSAAPAASAAAPPAPPPPAPLAVAAREVKVDSDLIDFEYSYPAAAGAIPALKALLDADLDQQQAALTAEAKAARKDAQQSGFDYRPYGYWHSWQTVTDLPGWLSLSARISTYEGGAHPNHVFDSMVWDRQAGVQRNPVDMFTSKAALSGAIKAEFCKAIDAQRKAKRGADWQLGGEFDACIDPVDNGAVILGSSNRKAFDRIGILVPPYNAGPYAEGAYEVTLPVTPAVLAAVRPEFRPTFVVKR